MKIFQKRRKNVDIALKTTFWRAVFFQLSRKPPLEHQRLTTTLPLTVQARTPKVAAMAKKFYIIDGHAHIYAAYYAPMGGDLTGPSGEPTKAAYIFTMAMLGLIQRL